MTSIQIAPHDPAASTSGPPVVVTLSRDQATQLGYAIFYAAEYAAERRDEYTWRADDDEQDHREQPSESTWRAEADRWADRLREWDALLPLVDEQIAAGGSR